MNNQQNNLPQVGNNQQQNQNNQHQLDFNKNIYVPLEDIKNALILTIMPDKATQKLNCEAQEITESDQSFFNDLMFKYGSKNDTKIAVYTHSNGKKFLIVNRDIICKKQISYTIYIKKSNNNHYLAMDCENYTLIDTVNNNYQNMMDGVPFTMCGGEITINPQKSNLALRRFAINDIADNITIVFCDENNNKKTIQKDITGNTTIVSYNENGITKTNINNLQEAFNGKHIVLDNLSFVKDEVDNIQPKIFSSTDDVSNFFFKTLDTDKNYGHKQNKKDAMRFNKENCTPAFKASLNIKNINHFDLILKVQEAISEHEDIYNLKIVYEYVKQQIIERVKQITTGPNINVKITQENVNELVNKYLNDREQYLFINGIKNNVQQALEYYKLPYNNESLTAYDTKFINKIHRNIVNVVKNQGKIYQQVRKYLIDNKIINEEDLKAALKEYNNEIIKEEKEENLKAALKEVEDPLTMHQLSTIRQLLNMDKRCEKCGISISNNGWIAILYLKPQTKKELIELIKVFNEQPSEVVEKQEQKQNSIIIEKLRKIMFQRYKDEHEQLVFSIPISETSLEEKFMYDVFNNQGLTEIMIGRACEVVGMPEDRFDHVKTFVDYYLSKVYRGEQRYKDDIIILVLKYAQRYGIELEKLNKEDVEQVMLEYEQRYGIDMREQDNSIKETGKKRNRPEANKDEKKEEKKTNKKKTKNNQNKTKKVKKQSIQSQTNEPEQEPKMQISINENEEEKEEPNKNKKKKNGSDLSHSYKKNNSNKRGNGKGNDKPNTNLNSGGVRTRRK